MGLRWGGKKKNPPLCNLALGSGPACGYLRKDLVEIMLILLLLLPFYP